LTPWACDEASVVADEFSDLSVPVIAVLGDHDYHSDAEVEITALLDSRGIAVLEGSSTVVQVGASTLGVAGVKGFGGVRVRNVAQPVIGAAFAVCCLESH
jgi:predicted MPP superfamily phosphohydrolase